MSRLLLAWICLALCGCADQTWPSVCNLAAPNPWPFGERGAQAARNDPRLLAAAQEGQIPLVPVPPPPLYKNEKGDKDRTDKNVRPVGGKDKAAENVLRPETLGAPFIGALPMPPMPPVPQPGPVLPSIEAVPQPQPMNPGPLSTNPVPLPPEVNPPQPLAPTGPAGPVSNAPPLEQILQAAQTRYAAIDSYTARFTRRETVGGKREAEELMLFRFRKEPYSVYLKWLGENAQGREVVFVQGKFESKIHTLLAAGDIPFMPAGKRMSLSPDNILVQSAARYPITRAGFGDSLQRLMQTVAAIQRGDNSRGQLTDLGNQRRPDYAGVALRMIEHTLPPGYEKPLPQGGKRLIGFCPSCQFPVLVQTFDDKGQEVEYYRYDRVQAGVALDDLDFNPEVLWKKP